MPESTRHYLLRTSLFLALRRVFRERAIIGSDQFVYWNAADPKRCLAPDVFVRLNQPNASFDSWKTWQRGAPEVAVEIVSKSDSSDVSWEEKLKRYHELGVLELVRFDADAAPGERLRVWDRIDGDLVERIVTADRTESALLGHAWVVAPADDEPVALRLQAPSGALLPTPGEVDSALVASEERAARLEAELEALKKR